MNWISFKLYRIDLSESPQILKINKIKVANNNIISQFTPEHYYKTNLNLLSTGCHT